MPVFLLLGAGLYAGLLFASRVKFPKQRTPAPPGQIFYIARNNRQLLFSLDSRSVLRRGFPAQVDPAQKSRTSFPLHTDVSSNPAPVPIPRRLSPVPFSYTLAQEPVLPPTEREDTKESPLEAPSVMPNLLRVPVSWGALAHRPPHPHDADPGWVGRKSSFLVVLGSDGRPEQLTLMESSGSSEADRAAAAFLRDARWSFSPAMRSALLSIEWEEISP